MAILSNGKFYGFLCSVKETGQKLKNGVKEYVEDFMSGFAGHGWKLWEYMTGKWKLEIDTIVVRETMIVFEMLISKIRAIIGAQTISQGHGKVKSARISDDGTEYLIVLEDEDMSIVAHDFVRCQTFVGDKTKLYHVEVDSVDVETKTLHIPLSEFDFDEAGNVIYPPAAGDELVQFGNSQNKARQSAIYLHADETGQPAIDVMFDIDSKNWDGKVKVRVGGDIPDSGGLKGFYCVNGMIRGVSEDGTVVYQINPDGSGFLGSGGIKWEKKGNPQFCGTILVKVDENNVWEVNEFCINLIGDKSGKHIEISPISSDIKIFKENGEVSSVFDGNEYNSLDELFSGTAEDVQIINMPHSNSHEEISEFGGSVTTIGRISNIFKTVGNVILVYSGKISLSQTISSGGSALASIIISVETYEDRNRIKKISSKTLMEASLNRTDSASYTISTPMRVSLTTGYNEITVTSRHEFGANSIGSNSTVSVDEFSAYPVLAGYVSQYFANGMALGSSNANLFSVLNTKEGRIVSTFCNDRYGIKFDNTNLLSKRNGRWGLLPSIICCGRITTVAGKATITKLSAFDGRTELVVYKLGTGYVRIVLQPTWVDIGINSANCYIMLTGVGRALGSTTTGGDSAIKATMLDWDENSIYIGLSDDATANDGDFYFEIKSW